MQRYKTTDHMVHADADPKGPLLFGDETQEYVLHTDYAADTAALQSALAAREAEVAGLRVERDEFRDIAQDRGSEITRLTDLLGDERRRADAAEAERDDARKLLVHMDGRANDWHAEALAMTDSRNDFAKGYTEQKARAEAAEARALALEYEVADLHDSIRTVYLACPQLPICAEHPEDFDAATNALHDLCLVVGIHGVSVPTLTPTTTGENEHE